MQCRTMVAAYLFAVAVPALASAQAASTPSGFVLYDNFADRFIDPAKWVAGRGICGASTLECVREVQKGHLRLSTRNIASRDSNSGFWYTESVLPFPRDISAATTGLQADITVREFDGVGCPANTDDLTHAQVMIGGNFFNSGDGTSTYDVLGQLIMWVDTVNSPQMDIGIWWGWPGQGYNGYWTHVASFPLGTPLAAALVWDQANHQFVASVRAKGDDRPPAQATASYGALGVTDFGAPADPTKNLYVSSQAMNCTANLSVSHVDALFDNVKLRR